MIETDFKKIFKNKKVIITGHTGFKGSWLSLWLSMLGSKVVGISKDIPTSPSHFKILKIENKINSIICDISDLKRLKKIILRQKPDFIFHLAAQAIVKNSFENPYKTWKSNLVGTINLLEVLKDYNKGKIVSVFITSDKVYKNFETSRAYKEFDQLGGIDPYSASKSAADIAIQSYLSSFNFKKANSVISIARAGNVIGGADWSDGRLIPDCVRAWSKNKKVIIRNLNSTRPWQHVLEVLSGYLKLAASGYYDTKLNGEIFNFGPNTKNKYKVRDVLEQSKFFWEKAKWTRNKDNRKFKESKLLHLNSEKARKKLSWKNLLSFKETLSLTIDWYKKYYEKKIKIEKISKNQIEFYQKKLKGI